jgi:hypothetical protein
MTYLQALQKTALYLTAGLLMGSALASLVFDVFILPREAGIDFVGTILRCAMFFYVSLFVSVPVMFFYGWPVYSFLMHKGWNNVITTLMIAFVPAAVLYPYKDMIGILAMLYGSCIGLVGHIALRRRPDGLFKKKKPLGSDAA